MRENNCVTFEQALALGMTSQEADDLADWHQEAAKHNSNLDDQHRHVSTRDKFRGMAWRLLQAEDARRSPGEISS